MTSAGVNATATDTATGPPSSHGLPLTLPADVTPEMIRDYAIHEGVCIRPVLRKVTDRATGEQHTVPIPCGATRDYRCPPCAAKARRVRMQQCREDWHLDEEPTRDEPDRQGDDPPQDDEGDGRGAEGSDEDAARRARSTRRRADTPGLPRLRRRSRLLRRSGRSGPRLSPRPCLPAPGSWLPSPHRQLRTPSSPYRSRSRRGCRPTQPCRPP